MTTADKLKRLEALSRRMKKAADDSEILMTDEEPEAALATLTAEELEPFRALGYGRRSGQLEARINRE